MEWWVEERPAVVWCFVGLALREEENALEIVDFCAVWEWGCARLKLAVFMAAWLSIEIDLFALW